MTKPVSTGEAARELGVGLTTLQRWAHQGYVRPLFVTPGGHFRWDVDDLRRQLASQGEPMIDPDAPIRPPIVAAIVTSGEGVLITRRHDGKPLWGFVTGEVESGESPGDAAVREVKEETGMQVKVSHVLGERDHPATHRHMFYLACRPYQGTEVFIGDPAELAAVEWVDYDTAVERLTGLFPPVREHLERTLKP